MCDRVRGAVGHAYDRDLVVVPRHVNARAGHAHVDRCPSGGLPPERVAGSCGGYRQTVVVAGRGGHDLHIVAGRRHNDHAGVDGPLYLALQAEETLAAKAHRYYLTAHLPSM